MNENSSTKGYHYESHSTEYQDEQGNVYHTSSVKIRELDEGEVGILLAGNNSIFDPTLTPRMLTVPCDYDISEYEKETDSNNEEEDEDEEDEEDEDDSSIEEKWFPSLLKHSWIYGLDNDEEVEDWMKKIKEIITSSEVIEKENNHDEHEHHHHHKRKRSKKSKDYHHDNDFTYSTITTTLVPVDITYILLNE